MLLHGWGGSAIMICILYAVCCNVVHRGGHGESNGSIDQLRDKMGSRGILDCPELSAIVNGISFAKTETVSRKHKSELGEWRCTPFERRETFFVSFYSWQRFAWPSSFPLR